MVIAQQMLTAEADAIAGVKGKRQAEQRARLHGHQGGRRQAWLGGRVETSFSLSGTF